MVMRKFSRSIIKNIIEEILFTCATLIFSWIGSTTKIYCHENRIENFLHNFFATPEKSCENRREIK